MLRNFKSSLLVLMALAIPVSMVTGCGKKDLVSVNGESISKDEFYSRLERVPVQTQAGTQLAGRYVVEQLINEQAITQIAKEEGVEPTEEQINKKIEFIKRESGGNIKKVLDQSGMTMEDLKNKVKVEQAYVNVVTKGVKIPASDVKAAYEQAIKMENSPFVRPEEVMISAVACNTKEKIDKAYKMLEGGTAFSTVAMQLSDNPVAKQNQGKLGWVRRGMQNMPEILVNTAFSLEKGKYSKPFVITSGNEKEWVIIKADTKRAANTKKFEDVKDMIQEQLAVRQGVTKNDFTKKMVKFLEDAKIEVNVERYKNIPDAMKKQAEQNAKAMAERIAGAKAAASQPKN